MTQKGNQNSVKVSQFAPVLFRVLGTLTAFYLGRFLGEEKSPIMPTGQGIGFGIILLSCIFFFRFWIKFNKKSNFLLFDIFCFFGVAFFFYWLRIYVLKHMGFYVSDVFSLFISHCAVSGSSNFVGNPRDASSFEVPASPVQLPALPAPEAPLQEIDQDLIWENLEAQEQEARAREDARIYAAVQAITEACDKEEAAMIAKAHILLHQMGITLKDPKDVKRALEAALYDDRQYDIDERLPHFRGLKRYFGTARCSIWNKFVDELRELGNLQINARHKLD